MLGNGGAGRGRITVVRSVVGAAAIAVVLSLTPVAAQAQGGVKFGVRGGFDIDPDAIVFGGHVMILNVVQSQPAFVIVPNIEFGFGSEGPADYTIIKFNGDTRWEFPLGTSGTTKAYPLAGLSLYRFSLSDCTSGVGFSCSNTEFGLNLGGGVRYKGFAIELKLGVGDIQDVHVGGSYTFGLN